MKKFMTAAILLLMITCGCAQRGGGKVDQLYFSDRVKAELLVFRCGDTYMSKEKGGSWLALYVDPPAELIMGDGEFVTISADIERVSGGEAAFHGNAYIRELHDYSAELTDELVNSGEIEAYDTADTVYYGPRSAESGGDLYIIVDNGGKYPVYRNGIYQATYASAGEAESAAGLSGTS